MPDETTVPTPDDSTPSGADHPFEPSPAEDAGEGRGGDEPSGGPPPSGPPTPGEDGG